MDFQDTKQQVFDEQEKHLDGKCVNIIAYNKPSAYCGLLVVNNPGYFYTFLALDTNTNLLKLRPKNEFEKEYTDIIQIKLQSKNILVKSDLNGCIFMSQHYELNRSPKFQKIFDDVNRVPINKLAFVSTSNRNILFFLDNLGCISTIEFTNQAKLIPTYKILSNIKIMIPASDSNSLMLVDLENNFIIFNQDSLKEIELVPLKLSIRSQDLRILNNIDENQRLKNSNSIDYVEHENGYFIYMIHSESLYKLSYEKSEKALMVKQIISVNKENGNLLKVVAYPIEKNQNYEVALVQEFSVNQYQLTKQLEYKNIWKTEYNQEQKAYNYYYKQFGTDHIHMIFHIADHLQQNQGFKYDISKSYVYAFKE